MAWQVQEAKQRFSEFIRRAIQDGPQVVTRHGEEVAVLLSVDAYRELSGPGKDFKKFLLSGPDLDELGIQRSAEPSRTVDL